MNNQEEEKEGEPKNFEEKQLRLRDKLLNEYLESDAEESDPKPRIGIAFSGGGIRSATLSLGITEALFRYDRIYSFDFMSTVSGGGYFGCFLRSLYLPKHLKGSDNQSRIEDNDKENEKKETFKFAHKALNSVPNTLEVPYGSKKNEKISLAHPIMWLREHGRYLAPDGAGDFVSGISYVIRNWIGLIFVLTIGMALVQVLLQGSLLSVGWILTALDWDPQTDSNWYSNAILTINSINLSPLIWPLIFFAYLSLATGSGYWMTRGLAYNPENSNKPAKKLGCAWFGIAAVIIAGLVAKCLYLSFNDLGSAADLLVHILDFLLAIAFSGIVVSAAAYFLNVRPKTRTRSGKNSNPTPLLRRTMLAIQTSLNQIFLALLVFYLLDSIAIWLLVSQAEFGVTGFWLLILQPVLAYLVKKAPDWFGGTDSKYSSVMKKNIALVAGIASILLYGSLALLVTVFFQTTIWADVPWNSDVSWPRTFLLFAIVLVLFVTLGRSSGFINLSSLHALYASRLTRAYIGGANLERLELKQAKLHSPTGLFDQDHIDAEKYFREVLVAPFHLVNVTINDTFAENNLIARDRKGRRATFGLDGLTIEGEKNPWSELSQSNGSENAEKLSIGQLCAISGAAASSGMGRLTKFGTALALTYANVRLGYWWDRHNVALNFGKREVDEIGTSGSLVSFMMQFTSTFVYLANEMMARYSSSYRRLYLSDGGHSENTGALSLLERNCETIVVADNGQDPDFLFSDLEIFIRTARIDLGYQIRIASKDYTKEFCGVEDNHVWNSFLNVEEDWKAAAQNQKSEGFALLLRAAPIPEKGDESKTKWKHIIWLKPKAFKGLPPDVATYAEMNAPFPQQTTADQFFDEAQWESYRRIGFEMAERLFSDEKSIPSIARTKLKSLE